MLATIILLVKNGEAHLRELLPVIYRQTAPFDFRVLAIDSGSHDGSREVLGEYPVTLVEIPPHEFNHGDTRNLGARLAGHESEVLVYLTQDALPANEAWLAHLVQPLLDDLQVAGAFSRHIPRPTTTPSLARQLLTRWQTGGTRRLEKKLPPTMEEYERDRFYYIFFSNTSSAIRRSAWEAVPFRRLAYAEDAEWADRAIRAGYTIVFEPRSVVIHAHDYSLVEQFRQNVDHARAMQRMFAPEAYARMRAIDVLKWTIVETVLDWRYILTEPPYCHRSLWRKLAWMARGPLWLFASLAGSYVGAKCWRSDRLIDRWLSRQERIRES